MTLRTRFCSIVLVAFSAASIASSAYSAGPEDDEDMSFLEAMEHEVRGWSESTARSVSSSFGMGSSSSSSVKKDELKKVDVMLTDAKKKGMAQDFLYKYWINDHFVKKESVALLYGNHNSEVTEDHLDLLKKVIERLGEKNVRIMYDADSSYAPHIVSFARKGTTLGISANPKWRGQPWNADAPVVTIENPYLRLLAFSNGSLKKIISSADSIQGFGLQVFDKLNLVLDPHKKGSAFVKGWWNGLPMGRGPKGFPKEINLAHDLESFKSATNSVSNFVVSDGLVPVFSTEIAYERLVEAEIKNLLLSTNLYFKGIETIQEQHIPWGVSVFGSGSDWSEYRQLIFDASRFLSQQGVAGYTGGSNGVMETANAGFFSGGGPSIGVPKTSGEVLGAEKDIPKEVQSLTLSGGDYECRIPLLLYGKVMNIFAPGGDGTLREMATAIFKASTDPAHATPFVLLHGDFYNKLYERITENGSPLPQVIKDKFVVVDNLSELKNVYKSIAADYEQAGRLGEFQLAEKPKERDSKTTHDPKPSYKYASSPSSSGSSSDYNYYGPDEKDNRRKTPSNERDRSVLAENHMLQRARKAFKGGTYYEFVQELAKSKTFEEEVKTQTMLVLKKMNQSSDLMQHVNFALRAGADWPMTGKELLHLLQVIDVVGWDFDRTLSRLSINPKDLEKFTEKLLTAVVGIEKTQFTPIYQKVEAEFSQPDMRNKEQSLTGNQWGGGYIWMRMRNTANSTLKWIPQRDLKKAVSSSGGKLWDRPAAHIDFDPQKAMSYGEELEGILSLWADVNLVKPYVGEYRTITNGAGIGFMEGEFFVTASNKRMYKVIKDLNAGADRRVYKIQDVKTEKFYVIKMPRTFKPVDAQKIQGERDRVKMIASMRLAHPKIVEAHGDYIIREWTEGARADEYLKQWEKEGFPERPKAAAALKKLFETSAQYGLYIGKLDAEDVVWDGTDFVIIDSGGIQEMSEKDIMAKYKEVFSTRWGDKVLKDATKFKAFIRGL